MCAISCLTCKHLTCVNNTATNIFFPPKDRSSFRDIQLCARRLHECEKLGIRVVPIIEVPDLKRSKSSHYQYCSQKYTYETCTHNISNLFNFSKIYMWGMHSSCNKLTKITYLPPKCALWVDINITSSDGVMCGPCNPFWSGPSRKWLRMIHRLLTLWFL